MAAVTMLAGNALAAGAFAAGPFSWATFAIATAGQLAQRALTPKQIVGRIADLSVQSAQEGVAIKEGYGTFSVAGTLIWSNGKTEHLGDEGGGKLGPPPPEYASYTSSFVSLLCASPTGNRIQRPLKLYFNQHLVYDYNGGDEKGGTVSFDAGNGCWSFTSGILKGKIRIYNGAQTTPDAYVAAAHAAIYDDPNPALMPAYVDRCILVAEEIELDDFGNDIPNIRVVLQSQNTTAKQCFDAICTSAKLQPSEFNGAALNSFGGGVNRFGGFVRQEVSPAKDFLQQLSTIFWCEFPTIDGKVTVKIKPGLVSNDNPTPDFVLTDTDLRWADNRPTTPTQIEYERASPRELPARVEYTWTDPNRRYNPAMRRSSRVLADAQKVVQLAVPASMSPGWAKTNATVELWRQNSESFIVKGMGDPKLYRMSCGDIVSFTKGNEPAILLRNAQKQTPMFGATQLGFVYHDPSIYSLGESADTARHNRDDIAEYDSAIIFAADAPPLSDGRGKLGGVQLDDPIDKPGLWVAGTARKGVPYFGGYFHIVTGTQEINNNARVETNQFPRGDQKAIMGYVEEDWTKTGPDVISNTPLKVRLYNGDLYSVSDTDIANGANILVFRSGRYLQWKTSTSTDPLSDEEGWSLTGIRDGINGSEFEGDAMSGTVIPAGTTFTVIMDEQARLAPGVAWLSADLNSSETYTPYNYVNNPYNLNKLFFFGKRIPDEKARVTIPIPNTWYRSRNIWPNPPKLTSATTDIVGGVTVGYQLQFRRYFRGGNEPEVFVTEPYPFSAQILVAVQGVGIGDETMANSKSFARTFTANSGTFTLTNEELLTVPGYTGTQNIVIRVRILGYTMPGRYSYTGAITLTNTGWVDQTNTQMQDQTSTDMEFKV